MSDSLGHADCSGAQDCDASPAQIKNAVQHDRFANLLAHVLAQIADIDANTVADPRWPNDAPAWWHDMTRLGYECYRIKARLG